MPEMTQTWTALVLSSDVRLLHDTKHPLTSSTAYCACAIVIPNNYAEVAEERDSTIVRVPTIVESAKPPIPLPGS